MIPITSELYEIPPSVVLRFFQQDEQRYDDEKGDADYPEDIIVGEHAGLPLHHAVENSQSGFFGGDSIDSSYAAVGFCQPGWVTD
jgi:hypothetical protein